jgi:hypothetical protein
MASDQSETIDVLRAAELLDAELIKLGEKFTLYICGGAALIFLGYSGRKTEDIDFIESEIDPILQTAADRAGKQLGYAPSWLNNDVADLGRRLGKGWKKTCTVVFNGEGLCLMSLSRQNLINSKLHAAVQRKAQDMDDLIFLRPDSSELEAAAEYATEQGVADGVETFGVWVNHYVRELKKDLGL